MADCKKCKHHPLYPTLMLVGSPVGDLYEVKFREGFYLETTDGLIRIQPSSRIRLTFTDLVSILVQENRAVFYFPKRTDHIAFIAAHPEYTTWDL